MAEQRKAIEENIKAKEELEYGVFEMLCSVYGEPAVRLSNEAMSLYVSFVRQYGAARVLEWIECAGRKGLSCWSSIRYVCGCARNARERASGANQ